MFTNTFKNNFSKYLLMALIICSFIIAQKAWSWKNYGTCNGIAHEAVHQLTRYELNRYTIFPGGLREADVEYSVEQWNKIQGMLPRFWTVSGSDSSTLKTGKGIFEIGWVVDLDKGAFGVNKMKVRPCIWPYRTNYGQIIGSSIWIASNYIGLYGNPDEATCDTNRFLGSCEHSCRFIGGGDADFRSLCANNPNDRYNVDFSYRHTLLHELGHSLGMDHHNEYLSIMGSRGPRRRARYYGDEPFAPMSDDVHFGHTYHRSTNITQSGWDFAALSWKMSETDKGIQRATMDSGIIEVCAGDTVDFRWTLENKSVWKNTENQKLTIEYGLLNHVNNTDPFSNSYRSIRRIRSWNNEPGWEINMYNDIMIPLDMPIGDYRVAVTVDPDDDFNDYNRSNNKTYLAPVYSVKDCSGDPSVSYPINTVSYHHINTRINYLVKDFPTHWTPKEIVLQVQPTDGYPLEGWVLVNGQTYSLKGWYTDIKVPHTRTPILYQVITPVPRDIRLEWWALDNDYFDRYLNRTPPEDPDCLESDCIPLKEMNKTSLVFITSTSKTVRLSGFPESWNPKFIVVGIHGIDSQSTIPSGYFRVFSRNSRFVQSFEIPNGQYYYEVKIPYAGEGHLDIAMSTLVSSNAPNHGYRVSWWPVTN